MRQNRRIVCAQLRVGDADLPSYRLTDILAKIDAAQEFAGLNRLLFLPTHNAGINKSIVKHCRKHGVEVYLWYKVLTDNDIMANRDELAEDAFGRRGMGETALWTPILNSEEIYSFGCPVNGKYNTLLLDKCKTLLSGDYDGLYADCIGYPLPSLGYEALFTCFCRACAEREPRIAEWRSRVVAMREEIECWTDADAKEVGDFAGLARKYGLEGFYTFRMGLITELSARYAKLARDMDKGFGLDVMSPALAFYAGHDLEALGALADFIKPRIYCNTYGPSSIPLEFSSMGTGLKTWAPRLGIPAVMDFIGKSTGLGIRNLSEMYLPHEAAREQIRRALAMAPTAVFPGIECSLHPDYETFIDEKVVAAYADASRDATGVVMAWNLLFMPEYFLRVVGDVLHAPRDRVAL